MSFLKFIANSDQYLLTMFVLLGLAFVGFTVEIFVNYNHLCKEKENRMR